MGRPDINLDMHTVLTHELTIKGSFRYVTCSETNLCLAPLSL